jgi:hypothetical protein
MKLDFFFEPVDKIFNCRIQVDSIKKGLWLKYFDLRNLSRINFFFQLKKVKMTYFICVFWHTHAWFLILNLKFYAYI